MNAKDLLNMDMETAIQWLLHFWRWWTNELTSMLPPEWRERLTRRNQIVAEMKGDALVYRNIETGQIIAGKPRGRVTFLMAPGQVLVREVELPLLPMSDVKRMIALDLDRLTPFQADQIYFDADIVSRDAENGRQQVAVGVLKRDVAAEVLSDVQSRDLTPAALGVKPRDGAWTPKFDFLAAMREAEGGGAAQRRSVYWWGGVAALLILNFAILTWRDSSSLDQLRQAVESQGAPVAVAMRTRDRVDREADRRAQLLEAKAKLSPLPVLDAVTAVMPQDAWVRRFEWNGRSVHIIGARKTSQDILARLEASPVLRNARSLSSDSHVDAAGYQSFEMSAEREFQTVKVAAAATPAPVAPAPVAAPRPLAPHAAMPKPAASSDDSDDDDSGADDTKPVKPNVPPHNFLRPGFSRPRMPRPIHPGGRKP
jgi:general secretion pathway protein L